MPSRPLPQIKPVYLFTFGLILLPLLLLIFITVMNAIRDAKFAYELKSSSLPVQQLWEFEAQEIIHSLYFAPDAIYFLTKSHIYAVARGSGELRWPIERSDVVQFIGPPAAGDNTLVVVSDLGMWSKRFVRGGNNLAQHLII